MNIDYINNLAQAKSVCREFKKDVMDVFFNGGSSISSSTPNYCETKTYQNYFDPLKKCAELCKLLRPRSIEDLIDDLDTTIRNLEEPDAINKRKDFVIQYDYLKEILKLASDEMTSFCSSFSEEETVRINEAIHTFFENCYYSCISMSVSAVESRLLKIMSLVNHTAILKLDKMTLGGLINEYSTNKNTYKNVVPEKHEALLKLCNTYRIYSVHPKKETISLGLASSILHLSLVFLSDKKTLPKTVRLKMHKLDNTP